MDIIKSKVQPHIGARDVIGDGNVLLTFPGVAEACVVGVPHEKWGEAVHAVIVLREGAAASEGDILAWCEGRIAGFKRPRSVAIRTSSPIPSVSSDWNGSPGRIPSRM